VSVIKRTLKVLTQEVVRSAALLLLVTLAMFIILRSAPGDPIALYVDVRDLSPAELAAVRHELGLDRTLPAQYLVWVGQLLRGDLGHSLKTGRPVSLELWRTGWRTILLTGSAMALTLLYAALAAGFAAFRKRASGPFTLLGYVLSGVPVFWLGYVAIFLGTKYLGVLPVMMGSSSADGGLRYFWVPVAVLGLGNGTVSEVTRHLRSHLEAVLAEDYMRTARAKGASILRHVYKDGFVMPLSSLLASKVPYLLSGAIVVEEVFNWPGMGRLTWEAAGSRDYPVLLGVTLVSALIVRAAHVIKQAIQVSVNPQLGD
jgi:peptide/nickel transport system permease protein